MAKTLKWQPSWISLRGKPKYNGSNEYSMTPKHIVRHQNHHSGLSKMAVVANTL